MDHNSSQFRVNADERYADGPQPENHVDSIAALPNGYGDNRIVILPRDPHWFFSYWEYTAEAIEAARNAVGETWWDSGTWVLRVYDVTDGSPDDLTHASFFDVAVSAEARQWYVRLDKSGRAVIVELGRRLTDGRFIALFRSNLIRLPVGRVSDKIDTQWMAMGAGSEERMQLDSFVEKLASVASDSKGSVEIAKTMARRWEFLRSVFSGSWPTSSAGSSHTFPAMIGISREDQSS